MPAGGGGVQSVERSLDLLDALFASGNETSLTELAGATGLPYATIHRLLKTMVDRGYVRQAASRRYSLGLALIRLGEHAGRALGLAAQPFLRQLVDLSGETANLAMLEGDRVVYVAQVPSPHSMRMFAEVGRSVMPHCTAVGKVLLASRPTRDVEAVLARVGLPPRTERTITDPEMFRAEIERVRAEGFASDDGEEEDGARCVAVPVVAGSSCLAAMSISGPEGRFAGRSTAGLLPAMQQIAERFATTLGPDGAGPPTAA